MNGVDFVIVGIVLLSAVIGLYRGLMRETLSLAVWFAAFVLALYLARPVSDTLLGSIDDVSIRLTVGFIIVFVGTILAGGVAQWLVARLIHTSGLTGTDRFLGFLFGSLRGVLVCIIALVAVRPFMNDYAWWNGSVLIPELLVFERDVLSLIGAASDWVVGLTQIAAPG